MSLMGRCSIGFGAPVSGSWATPDRQIEIAQRAEALGYQTLWTFSRILYSDAPEETALAPPYRSVHDPLVVAAFLAAVTSRVRLGLAVVNLPFYPPLVLAKALTSLDIVSEGRLDAGLGLGWEPEEFAAAGVDMARRGDAGRGVPRLPARRSGPRTRSSSTASSTRCRGAWWTQAGAASAPAGPARRHGAARAAASRCDRRRLDLLQPVQRRRHPGGHRARSERAPRSGT